jgi:hypothetical protein
MVKILHLTITTKFFENAENYQLTLHTKDTEKFFQTFKPDIHLS